ncbi:MAG: hypothetical protein ACE5E0_06015 [Terriglobia bacterium]
MGFKRRSMVLPVVLGAVLVPPTVALAQENGISTGDTAWVMMSCSTMGRSLARMQNLRKSNDARGHRPQSN